MSFILTPNVTVISDPDGRVRELEHLRQPFDTEDSGLTAEAPIPLADQYLWDVAQIYQIHASMLAELDSETAQALGDRPPRLRLAHQSSAGGAMVVSYAQTVELNNRVVPYHNAVHNAAGGQMPNPDTSPGDPIFWPFHAFLVAVYER